MTIKTIRPIRRDRGNIPQLTRDYDSRSQRHCHSTKWAVASAAFVKQYPLCVLCAVHGMFNQSASVDVVKRQRTLVVDHIERHREDINLFWNTDNWETLCRTPCHDADKARHERSGGNGEAWIARLRAIADDKGSWGFLHDTKQWIPPGLYDRICNARVRQCVVVVGPPCSGKTTFVRNKAAGNDFVWDWDDCAYDLLHRTSRDGLTTEDIAKVASIRDRRLSEALCTTANVWWITSTMQEARRVSDVLGARIHIMDTPLDVCVQRCEAEGAGEVTRNRIEAIRQWRGALTGTPARGIGGANPGGLDAVPRLLPGLGNAQV